MEALDDTKYAVTRKVVTWPNVISASRILAGLLMAWVHRYDGTDVVFLLLIGWIILSDYLDGWLARITGDISELGKFLDPLADKICAAILFVYAGYAGLIPWWFITFSVIRDTIIGIGGTMVRLKRGKALMAVWSGKVGVNAVAVYWLAAFYFPDNMPLLLFLQGAAFMMLLYAFHDYVLRSWKAWNGADFN
jgi:CDP-diacylglycerol--glycerol-3-phosphate 3-phosphatidyltransferase